MPMAAGAQIGSDDEAEVLRRAWLELTSSVPDAQKELIARHQFADAALNLVERAIGRDHLVGWRLTFTPVGGPYGAMLFVRRTDTAEVEEISQEDDSALSVAIVKAVRTWHGNRPGGSARA